MNESRIKRSERHLEIPQGTDEGVAVDEMITGLRSGDLNRVLHSLHEPHLEADPDRKPPKHG